MNLKDHVHLTPLPPHAPCAQEYQAQQATVKGEPIEVHYSYWDGQGHRRRINVRKGDSIGAFLKSVREQLSPTFKELRVVSVDNLMFIKVTPR